MITKLILTLIALSIFILTGGSYFKYKFGRSPAIITILIIFSIISTYLTVDALVDFSTKENSMNTKNNSIINYEKRIKLTEETIIYKIDIKLLNVPKFVKNIYIENKDLVTSYLMVLWWAIFMMASILIIGMIQLILDSLFNSFNLFLTVLVISGIPLTIIGPIFPYYFAQNNTVLFYNMGFYAPLVFMLIGLYFFVKNNITELRN